MRIFLLFVMFMVAFSSVSKAEVSIDITGGRAAPMPIAVPDFISIKEDIAIGRDVASVVMADLKRSGLFRIMGSKAFLQKFDSINTRPRFADWKVINAQALVQGRVETLKDGRLRVEFRLWDVFSSQQLKGQAYVTESSNWRSVAHIISDAVYERITGEKGYFDTRIVYIGETGIQTNRVKRLAIMDQDGANNRFLTDGSTLVLTPRFSPTSQEITYFSYFNDVPRVYLFNINTGKQELLGNFPGMTFAPRFSPNGKKIIISMANKGNTEIYEMELASRRIKRLTKHPAIDTSPSYSPDSSRITFNSDRGGSQQIYVMNSNGSNVRRISFGKGRYATPVWSPRGDYIAFTKMYNKTFYIGVMHPDGSGERLLASGYLVEAPTWAPNGRVLMFFQQTKADSDGKGATSKLYSIDLTGYNEHVVITPTDASDPAWSPILH